MAESPGLTKEFDAVVGQYAARGGTIPPELAAIRKLFEDYDRQVASGHFRSATPVTTHSATGRVAAQPTVGPAVSTAPGSSSATASPRSTRPTTTPLGRTAVLAPAAPAVWKVDTDEVATASTSLSSSAEAMEQAMSDLSQKVTGLLDNDWKGQAADGFHGAYDQWMREGAQLKERLDAIASTLSQVGERYTEVHFDVKKAWQ